MTQILPPGSNVLAAIVDGLDPSTPIDLSLLSRDLRAALGGEQPPPPPSLETAEWFAFQVIGRREGGVASPWGDHFLPFISLVDADGKVWENPPGEWLNSDWSDYWARRSAIVVHPIARARYADLAWDLWKRSGGKHPGIEVPRRAIDAYVEVLNRRLQAHEVWAGETMSRALQLALGIGDGQRVQEVVTASVAFQRGCIDPDKPGTWGMAFKALLGPDGPSVDAAAEKELVAGIEAHVARSLEVTRASGIPHPAMDFVRLLADHYRRKGAAGEVKRVLELLKDAMLGGNQSPAGLVRLAWYDDLDKLLRDHGLFDMRTDLAEPLRAAGKAAAESLHPIATEFTIPKKEMAEFVESYTSHPGADLFAALASGFVVPKQQVLKQVDFKQRKTPLSGLVSTKILDSRGRAVATVGPVADDPVGNLIALAAQAIQIDDLLLREVIDSIRASGRLDESMIVAFCLESPAFDADREAILRRGVRAYIEHDWIVALHTLVPSFEEGVRALARISGPMLTEVDPDTGGRREPMFGKLLRHQPLVEAMGEDRILHWMALFSDPRGVNLRNRVAHGLLTDTDCSRQLADRAFHSILQVGEMRVVTVEDGPDSAGGAP